METYNIAHLIPCKGARFISTFVPHLDSTVPAYIAKIPAAMDLSMVAALLLNEKDIEGFNTYQATEYFQEINEIILAAFEHQLIPIVVGSSETLRLMETVIKTTIMLPYNFNFFHEELSKRKKFRYCFFTFEEGTPCYYEFEYPSMLN